MTDVNLNDRVWVRLTEHGKAAFDKHHADMGIDPDLHRRIADAGDGWSTFQMWNLVTVFGGPHVVYLGSPFPFEDGTIHFTDPRDNGSTET